MNRFSFLYLYLAVYRVSAETGLADEFQPSVKASCVGGTMTIRVDTALPFDGVVHGPNRTEPGCSVTGKGGLKTYLKIDLGVPAGLPGSCGVKYNPDTEERRVAIGVRAHNTIELLEDRLYVVTCGKAGFQNSRNEVSVVQLKVTDGFSKKNTVLEGSAYTLRAEVLNHDPNYGILVKRCFAFDNSDTSVELVDDRGCRTQKLISEFSYDDSAGTADATLHSMFRMPSSNRTYFQCDVEICRGSCPKPSCDLDKEQITQKIDNSELKSVDPFARSQSDDTVTTSTSVFVAQPGSSAAVGAAVCTVGDLNPSWLTYLCIAFGVLFAIMLLINIFLCSAMTCSCTRTDVIEEEPSIYDDYSVYESQYGYASKAYQSESDSDYGVVGRGAPSEYSTQEPGQNGLSRSRQGSHGGSRYLDQ
eukprot:GFUD01036850.1.p1 GENE.GFUD01036850.1~~GFUD01036850.1.p1  ORF type:complete len:417 (-),score=100.38 GFUD01036850.1:338-1588(-)